MAPRSNVRGMSLADSVFSGRNVGMEMTALSAAALGARADGVSGQAGVAGREPRA
ncbi:MAG TPA: hypothetical protein VFC03_04600 [Acidimicrobiales bacterium]|nr:hypothetical protein [Acidimicrobiales bacterium]